jgi:hypothetical protein
MKDTPNTSAWNDWANYLLYIVKKHDGDIEKIEKDIKEHKEEFQKFLREDYIIFKTEIKTAERRRNKLWGIILGAATIVNIVLTIILRIVLKT